LWGRTRGKKKKKKKKKFTCSRSASYKTVFEANARSLHYTTNREGTSHLGTNEQNEKLFLVKVVQFYHHFVNGYAGLKHDIYPGTHELKYHAYNCNCRQKSGTPFPSPPHTPNPH
jgi:hypothetical protein